MNRQLIRYVATILDETGIEMFKKDDGNSKVWRFVTGIGFISTALPSLGMFSILNSDDFSKFFVPTSYYAIFLINVGGFLIIFHHKEIISEMLHQMDVNMHKYPDEEVFDIRYNKWYLKEKNIVAFMSAVLCFQYFFLSIICLPGILEVIFQGEVVSYIYPGWVPWKTEELKLQLLKLVIQILQGIYGVWTTSVILISNFVVIFEFLRQFHRLSVAIRSLKQRSLYSTELKIGKVFRNKEDLLQENHFHSIMRENIIQCVRHHQMLQKNFNLFKTWFSVFFSWELAVCVLSFALGLYVLLNAPGFAEIAQYISVASLVCGNLLCRCLAGEILLHLNNDLKNVLFGEVEWVEMNRENRKLLVIFHHMVCRPFQLYGFQIFGVTRITFAKIIRVTYSAFNIINISFQKS